MKSRMAAFKSGPDKRFLASSCDVIFQYHAKKMAPEGAYLTQHTHKEHSTSLLLSISHVFLNQQPLKSTFLHLFDQEAFSSGICLSSSR